MLPKETSLNIPNQIMIPIIIPHQPSLPKIKKLLTLQAQSSFFPSSGS